MATKIFNCDKIKMQKGSKGDDVKKLQQYLHNWGYYNYSIDGDFGDKTQGAVKAFQKAYKLTETGIFEKDTCKKFHEVVDAKENNKNTTATLQFDCPKTNLKKGSTDKEAVKKLQTMLKELKYYNYNIDGDYGDETVKSVKAFQTDTKHDPDGVFGPKTCPDLNKAYTNKKEGKKKKIIFNDDTPDHLRIMTAKLVVHPEVVVLPDVELAGSGKSVTEGTTTTTAKFDCSKINLKEGSKGEDVKKLQNILKSRGYYTRQVDGDYGKYTKEAVKKLQRAQGNSEDGEFGPKTCNKLQGTTDATGNKKKNLIITDFQNITTSNDNDGLANELTITTPYTKEKLNTLRKLQKTTFDLWRGKEPVYHHEGYINGIKVSSNNETYQIELQIVGYTAFLEKTITTFEKTAKRSELLKELIKFAGLKADVDLSGLPDDEYTLKITQETNTNTTSSSGGGGLTQVSGNDCTGGAMQTNQISKRSFDIDTCGGNTKIGNSSANYATDTANMSAREAIMDTYNRFRYKFYYDNRTCPRSMWNKTGSIVGNCADISRLVKCLGDVHGIKVGIRHMSGHYYNLIEVDGKTYRFDCCCKYSGSYRGETTNNLSKRGGPWS